MERREIEKTAVCRCARCGEVIEFCTRDNPCPSCGCTEFRVKYREEETFLP